MKQIILKHLSKMEFVCGLKQFREYSSEDAKELLECLLKLFTAYGWMSEERVDYIIHSGMRGHYGDFYHVNEKTVSGWINKYYAHHQSTIIQEVQAKNAIEKTETPEEIAYWIEIGKQIFRTNYESAMNTGHVKDLSEWGMNWWDKFCDKGILKPWDFPVEEIEANVKKELRIAGQWADESKIAGRSRNKIWRLFIQMAIHEKMDLHKLI
jgi:hypothetical protein